MLANLVIPKLFLSLHHEKGNSKNYHQVALYALGLIAAYFGVSTMTSCSTSHNVVASGRTTIVSVDTTIVKHNGFVRSKNYSPYE